MDFGKFLNELKWAVSYIIIMLVCLILGLGGAVFAGFAAWEVYKWLALR